MFYPTIGLYGAIAENLDKNIFFVAKSTIEKKRNSHKKSTIFRNFEICIFEIDFPKKTFRKRFGLEKYFLRSNIFRFFSSESQFQKWNF